MNRPEPRPEPWGQTLARLRRRWFALARPYFWGDWVDGRFLLARWLKAETGGPILDVGCGAGLLLAEARGEPKLGVDVALPALQAGQRACPEAAFAAADAAALPFKDQAFAVVILSGVLSGWPTPAAKRRLLDEVHRVLKPGGRLYTFNFNVHHWAVRDARPAQLSFDQQVELLRQAGLKTLQASAWNPLPSLVFFLPRRLKLRLADGPARRFLFFPSPLLALLPGLPWLFERLGRSPALRDQAKSFVILAEKTWKPG